MVDGRMVDGRGWSRLTSRLRTADPETLPDGRSSLAVEVVGATRARCPAHLEAPRGVLRRPGEHVEGNLRKLMQVGAAGASPARGAPASPPARRSPLPP